MRPLVLVCLVLIFVGTALHAIDQHPQSSSSPAPAWRFPLGFEQNQGQTSSQVQYLARSGRYRLYLTKDGATLTVAGRGKNEIERTTTDAVLRTTILGMSPDAQAHGMQPQPAKTNYMVGPEAGWKIGVPNYARVRYGGIYPGIDLVYYGNSNGLEYDFFVAPHADSSVIALKIEGADKITVAADGSLVLQTAAGEVRWRKPVAYQNSSKGRRLVPAVYRVVGNEVRFGIDGYDRTKTLVIDPALVYGTYIDGANGFDGATAFKVDAAGFAYVVGGTSSTDFPTTPGAYKRQINTAFNNQIFVSKVSRDGSSLIWSTIIGGSGVNNIAFVGGLDLDASGNVYLVGSTADVTYDDITGVPTYYPSTFPTTPGAYNTHPIANWREFLLRLNSSGSALDYSTFLSDGQNLTGWYVAVDSADSPYVFGTYKQTSGGNQPFPCTPGAYQCTYAGDDDGFVMKFNSVATQLVYATLLGGLHSETPSQILVNAAGEATIAGQTYSTNYPITANGMRQTDAGGFVTTLNAGGTGLVYSTVINHTRSLSIKRDNAGNYYVGGAAGTNLPVTVNAYQKTFPAVGSNVHLGFLTVIGNAGNLVYSSYIGGNPPSTVLESTQVQLVSLNRVTVTGTRYDDTNFPITDRTYEQDSCSFLATFNPRAATGPASLVSSGCTPIGITNNLVHEVFRGALFFQGATLYLDPNRRLYGVSPAGQTSANAFQQSPPDPLSGEGYHVWIGKYNMNAAGPGGVNLSRPYQWGAPYGNPVLYRATARSPQCAAGIAAMRVYISPGVWANTTPGATLNAYITFPSDGTYNSVIVAYDNCGHAFTKTDPILIQSTAGTTGSVGVGSPVNNTIVTSPVHFVANAQAPGCANGIAAMRVYTAPGVNAYTVNSSSLDTHLNLAPGTYNTVIQAWDNCNHTYSALPLNITVR
ncbi:MAG TPA: hypothetical protein VGF08_08360 [Terriglobales bacterium]